MNKKGKPEPKMSMKVYWYFLLACIIIYVAVVVLSPGIAISALSLYSSMLVSIVPVVVIVFVVVLAVNMFLEPARVARNLGKDSGPRGWLIAILGGLISMGPAYMWYPMLSDLRRKGMKESLIAVFIYNRSVKIILLPVMIYYFGWIFTTVLLIYMITLSVINGIIIGFKKGGV